MLTAAVLAALAGMATGVALHLLLRSGPRSLSAPSLYGQVVWAPGSRPAPSFALRDQDGRLVSLPALRGRTVLVAFMGPLCTKACPLEGRGLAAADQQVAPSERATLVIVSLDPGATPAQARRAIHRWGIVGDWHWLLGTRSQLAPVWRSYGVTAAPAGAAAGSSAVYVVDRGGFERAGVHAPFLPQFVADDLRALAG